MFGYLFTLFSAYFAPIQFLYLRSILRSRDVNKHGGGVNNLNPFSLDNQNKYGRRAHLLKPNLNTSYFQDGC